MAQSDAVAYLNHGRWVIDCPGCSNAYLEASAPSECVSCGTKITIVSPSDKDRTKIMAEVASRPEQNQNWEPGEDLDYLRADNIVHALDNP